MRLILFYPVRGIGGSQLAFARMAREIVRWADWQVVVVDFSDGFIRRTLTEWGVAFDYLEYREGGQLVEVGEGVLFLSLSGLPHDLAKLKAAPATRVLLWSLLPQAVLAFFRFGFLYNRLPAARRGCWCRVLEPRAWRRIREMIAQLERAGSLAYMDGPNKEYPRTLGIPEERVTYLPVPMEPRARKPGQWRDGVSIAWLGRVVRDKANTIVAMLELCSRYAVAHDILIDFHVIGDGPALPELRRREIKGVRCHFAGVLREAALDDYLAAHVQVGFAMGTSLLEFAMRGVPTIVGDYLNRTIPPAELPLRWLVPNADFSLGEIIGERPRRPQVNIADIVALCRDRERHQALGDACRAYAENAHGLASAARRLDRLLRGATFSFEAARSLGPVGEPQWGPRIAGLWRKLSRS